MAMNIEIGECKQCQARNPKALQLCRDCGATLPWAKPGTVPARSGPARPGPAGGSTNANAPAFNNSTGQPPRPAEPHPGYAIPWLQVFGGLIFVAGIFFWTGNVFGFFPTFPGVGYVTILIGSAMFKAGWGE